MTRPAPRPSEARNRRARRLGGAVALATALVAGIPACTDYTFFPLPVPDLSITSVQEVRMVVDTFANENSPVAVDVLVVYDEELLKRLLGLTARQWFTQRDQFRRDFPLGYDAWEWEVVPGQQIDPQPLSEDAIRSVATLVFADYQSEGEHRARIDQMVTVLVRLGEKSFTIESVKE